MTTAPHIVALAAEGSGPAWNMLARCGEWDLASGGRQSFTPELFAGLVESFNRKMASKRWPIGAPVGANHALFTGAVDAESAKALGYVKAMEQRDGPDGPGTELWGLIDWTDEGRRRIQAREYQGGSIEYMPGDAPDFLGHSATNHPAVHGLAPMAASEGRKMSDTAALTAQIEALTERLTAAEARAVKAESAVQEYRDREIATAAEALVSEGRFAATDAGRAAAKVMLASMDVEAVRAAIPAPVKATEPKRGEELVHTAAGLSGAGAGAASAPAPKVALGAAPVPADLIAQMRALREQQLRQIAAEQEV